MNTNVLKMIFSIRLIGVSSLKSRRSLESRLVTRIRKKWNVSCRVLDAAKSKDFSHLGVVLFVRDTDEQAQLEAVIPEWLSAQPEIEVERVEMECL